MTRLSLSAGLVCAAFVGCGPPPAQVAGMFNGQGNLIITGSAGEAGAQGISIVQTGSDIAFDLSMCAVKASADTTSSFKIGDFKCSKIVVSQTWDLTGTGSLTSNANAVNVTVSGQAHSGAVTTPFTWTFSGSRTP